MVETIFQVNKNSGGQSVQVVFLFSYLLKHPAARGVDYDKMFDFVTRPRQRQPEIWD